MAALTIEQIIMNHNIGVNLSDAATLGGKLPAEFANKVHEHNANDITTGTMLQERLPKATINTSGIVSLSTSTDSDANNLAATPSAVKAVKALITNKAEKVHQHKAEDVKGGTFPELIRANSNNQYGTMQIRNTLFSTRAPQPSDGNDGDIWFQYK